MGETARDKLDELDAKGFRGHLKHESKHVVTQEEKKAETLNLWRVLRSILSNKRNADRLAVHERRHALADTSKQGGKFQVYVNKDGSKVEVTGGYKPIGPRFADDAIKMLEAPGEKHMGERDKQQRDLYRQLIKEANERTKESQKARNRR